MSNYQPKPGDFSLFQASPEDKERAGDSLVMTGSGIDLDGNECWVSVYKATRKDGSLVTTRDDKQIYNLRLKPKQARPQAEPQQSVSNDLDDDLPF